MQVSGLFRASVDVPENLTHLFNPPSAPSGEFKSGPKNGPKSGPEDKPEGKPEGKPEDKQVESSQKDPKRGQPKGVPGWTSRYHPLVNKPREIDLRRLVEYSKSVEYDRGTNGALTHTIVSAYQPLDNVLGFVVREAKIIIIPAGSVLRTDARGYDFMFLMHPDAFATGRWVHLEGEISIENSRHTDLKIMLVMR